MKQTETKFDTETLCQARHAMRFMVVLDGSSTVVESMFVRLEDATSHALELIPFRNDPVHVYSASHGDCLLTVWPRDVKGDDLHGQIHKA